MSPSFLRANSQRGAAELTIARRKQQQQQEQLYYLYSAKYIGI